MDKVPAPTFVGIDVAKHRLDVHLRPSGEGFTIDHGEEEVAALVARLAALAPTLVVLEATGGMEARLAAGLAAAGLPVAVVNPRQVRAFARATGRLAKTDRLDAMAIARFAEAVRPPVRPLPDEATRYLGALVARRRQLLEMLVAERNRRQAADPALHGRIDAHLCWLEEALAEIGRDLDEAVRGARPGRPRRRCSARCPASGTSARARCWPSCPSSAPSPVGRRPLWSGWRRSAATAASCGTGAPSGAAGRPCAPACTWLQSRRPGAATR
jgi:transposase